MIRKFEGIVVSEKNFRETSKIIQVLTKEEGLISFIAKGAKNLKSDLRCSTTKLTYGIFNAYYKEDSLSTLTSVDIISNYQNIKKDIEKISYASFLLELTTQVIKNNAYSDVYSLLIDALDKIEEGYNPLIITNIIELKYLDFLGVSLVLDECAICGSKNNIVTISSSNGGLICKNCLKNDKIVNEKVIKLLRMYYYVDISKISKLDVKEELINEINEFLDGYYDKYTGLYLKTKSFLKNLNKISMKR